jgi:SAM-dependent methyltransferase
LKECQRILRPGGVLVLTTPNSEAFGARLFGRDWLALDPPRHLTVFSGHALRRLIEEQGFRLCLFRSTTRWADYQYIFSAALRRGDPVVLESRPPLRRRLLGKLFQIYEEIRLRRHPWCGEELLAVAEKT